MITTSSSKRKDKSLHKHIQTWSRSQLSFKPTSWPTATCRFLEGPKPRKTLKAVKLMTRLKDVMSIYKHFGQLHILENVKA